MSAITGIFNRDYHSVSFEQINKMNNVLSHRGPDGSNIWFKGPVAFGHQMLHTTPESLNEELPFEDPDSGLIITADARIDNRSELAPLLGLKDIKTVSDSIFILKSFNKWGEKCTENLLGDFAFVIYDPRKEQLFCARDHMGVKPFYYFLSEDLFVFSTEMKAIFAIDGVPSSLNKLKVALYLSDIRDVDLTFYDAIDSLKPAHFMKINFNQTKIEKYWYLNHNSELIMDNDMDYINAFKAIFREAIKCRMRSAFPIGFELSGGLDSSSIVAMAKKINDEKNLFNPLNTYSYIFDKFPQCDESYFIEKLLKINEFQSYFIEGSNINPLENIDNILWHLEQPVFTPFSSMHWHLYRKMNQKGMRVHISGNGGDEILTHGQFYLKDLLTSLNFTKFIKEFNYSLKNTNLSILNYFKRNVFFPMIPEHIKKQIRPLTQKLSNKPHLLNDDFSTKINFSNFLEENYYKPLIQANTAKKYHYYLINLGGTQYVLETIDKGTSAFQIEPRYPFYDKRLIEFCYAIPSDLKYRYGLSRYILRAAMEKILPPEIQYRKDKSFFQPIYQKNLLLFEKNLLKTIINDNTILKDYLNYEDVYKLCENYKNNSIHIWLITLLTIWFKKNNIDY